MEMQFHPGPAREPKLVHIDGFVTKISGQYLQKKMLVHIVQKEIAKVFTSC
jgi:hypothetical protein